jgi:dihydroorotate dehydrogenase electron transfer subunit
MVKPGRGSDPLLRRPFSVFEVIRTGSTVEGLTLLNKRIGVTTGMLFDTVEGDFVSCLGPLGRPFSLIDPPAQAWMVAGGVGLAAFATLADALRIRHVPTTLFYGARSARELFYLDWFKERGIQVFVATEDGMAGDRGRVTVPLERELNRARSTDVIVYACGPEPMLAAVARLADRFGKPSQVSVERVMGCGLGGCYSCIIPLRNARGDHHYVRSCIGGPVFAGNDIVWD